MATAKAAEEAAGAEEAMTAAAAGAKVVGHIDFMSFLSFTGLSTFLPKKHLIWVSI